MTEAHSQTHAQDGRGERDAGREFRKRGTGAKKNKRWNKEEGVEFGGAEEKYHTQKRGRHCSWPRAMTRDGSQTDAKMRAGVANKPQNAPPCFKTNT